VDDSKGVRDYRCTLRAHLHLRHIGRGPGSESDYWGGPLRHWGQGNTVVGTRRRGGGNQHSPSFSSLSLECNGSLDALSCVVFVI
jgi:hypothetical protein